MADLPHQIFESATLSTNLFKTAEASMVNLVIAAVAFGLAADTGSRGAWLACVIFLLFGTVPHFVGDKKTDTSNS
jgi:hypothetical protein